MAGCGDDEEEPAAAAADESAQKAEKFPADTTMGKIQEKGEIAIGVKYDVPPFGFKNPQSGDIEGFDVDVGQAIADKLGVKPKFIEAISDNRIPFLKNGTADLILSTMTINEERDQEIDFSEPYFVARGPLLVGPDSKITGVEDLRAARASAPRSARPTRRPSRSRRPQAERKLVDSYSECLELIQNGAVDAVSTDDVILTGMIIQDDTLKLVGDELTTEPYGAGIKDGDTEFKEFVDGTIAEFKSDGRWKKTYEKWVGQYTNEQQEPPTMTLEEALEATS